MHPFLPIYIYIYISEIHEGLHKDICEPFTLVFFCFHFWYINDVLYLNEPINSATNNSLIHVFLILTAQWITAGKGHMHSYLLIAIISGHLALSITTNVFMLLRRVWRYQRGNQNPYIEKDQTTQWPKEKKYKRTNNDLQNIHKT